LTGCFDFAIASSSSITVAGLDNVTAGWVGPQAPPFATVNVAIDHLTLTSAAIQTEIQPSQVAALQTDLQTPSGLFTYKSGAVWTFADLPAGNFEIQLSLIGSPAQYYQLGISAVPEPKGAAMFAAGLAGLGVLVRRRSAGHASRGLLSKP
jgi:hypothetical protein